MEYCLRETLNATCPVNEMIMVTRAQYGRMRVGRCIKQNYGHVGCEADVTAFVEDQCSGRRHCQLPVKRLIDVAEPCPADVTSHLDVTYTCVTGAPAPRLHIIALETALFIVWPKYNKNFTVRYGDRSTEQCQLNFIETHLQPVS